METFPTTYMDGSVQKRLPNPARPITDNIKFNIITTEFDSGHQQRRQKSASKTTWDLTYPILTSLQMKEIQDFFTDMLGPLTAFYWVHPVDKVQYKVHFGTDTLIKKNIGHNAKGPLYSLEIKLEQDF